MTASKPDPDDSEPPHLRRQRGIGKVGRQAEAKTARRFGGRQRVGSGAVRDKGDIEAGNLLIEAKSSSGERIPLQLAWLRKIALEARSEGKTPVLTVAFTHVDGRPVDDGAWVMVPEGWFREHLVQPADETA